MSLLEILMAVTILAFAFVPVLTHSQATVHETQSSQEDILARHFLVDLVERYKAASVEELRNLPLPVPEPVVTLGTDHPAVAGDALLSDRARVFTQLTGLVSSGYTDGSLAGLKKFIDLGATMKMTRLVTFKPDTPAPGIHELSCVIRWKPRTGPGERSLKITKVVVRALPADVNANGNP